MIQENDTVIVRSVDEINPAYYILQASIDQKLGKTKISLLDVVGDPYTSCYELNGRKFRRITDVQNAVDLEGNDNSGDTEGEILSEAADEQKSNDKKARTIKGNNSGYVDNNTAQKLKDVDIQQFKDQGLSASEIIKSLIDNSETFALKSDFAQEKWIKRKEKKYLKIYQIFPANPLTLCESSYRKNHDKVSNLRYESFAQLLSQAGIHAGCHVLVLESMVGMITGACAYRMAGEGRILTLYGGQQPHLNMAKCYNLNNKERSIIDVRTSLVGSLVLTCPLLLPFLFFIFHSF
jgi:hypothetical protein